MADAGGLDDPGNDDYDPNDDNDDTDWTAIYVMEQQADMPDYVEIRGFFSTASQD